MYKWQSMAQSQHVNAVHVNNIQHIYLQQMTILTDIKGLEVDNRFWKCFPYLSSHIFKV